MWCPASKGEVQESIGTFSLSMKVDVSACTARRPVIADVDMSRAGLRRSTTDQANRGAVVPLVAARQAAMCSRAAVLRWLTVHGDDPGPLNVQATRTEDLRAGLHRLSDRAVTRIVQSALSRAGRDATGYTGHSLRRPRPHRAPHHPAVTRVHTTRVGQFAIVTESQRQLIPWTLVTVVWTLVTHDSPYLELSRGLW